MKEGSTSSGGGFEEEQPVLGCGMCEVVVVAAQPDVESRGHLEGVRWEVNRSGSSMQLVRGRVREASLDSSKPGQW